MSVVTPLDGRMLQVADARHEDDDWREAERDYPVPSARFRWLGSLNWFLALLILPPLAPVIGLLAAITRLSSRGPALYRQIRVGLRGRAFSVYKIRTMSNDAEAVTGPVWSPGAADPRVTKFGRFLRKSHLDELPQLFNVLAGDMTLIGPRPERPEFTQFLAQEIPGYVGRLTVKPGITGLAQINLHPDTDLESVRKKLELDLEYICNSNFWVDVRILVCTALKVFGFPGYRMAKLFRLTRRPAGQPRAANLGQLSVSRGLDEQHDQDGQHQQHDQTRVEVVDVQTDAEAVHLRPLSLQDRLAHVHASVVDGSVVKDSVVKASVVKASAGGANGHRAITESADSQDVLGDADVDGGTDGGTDGTVDAGTDAATDGATDAATDGESRMHQVRQAKDQPHADRPAARRRTRSLR